MVIRVPEREDVRAAPMIVAEAMPKLTEKYLLPKGAAIKAELAVAQPP